MKRSEKKHKKHFRRWRMLPLRYKLSIYFMAFSAAMLGFLWIFQTTMLETCYSIIKENQVKNYAAQITESIKSGNDTTDTINTLSRQNEMSVYVYDSSDAIFTKKYESDYINPLGLKNINNGHTVQKYYSLAKERDGKYIATEKFEKDELNMEFRHFSDDKNEKGKKSRNATADEAFTDDDDSFEPPEPDSMSKHHIESTNLIYAEILQLDDETECFVLIAAMVTPVKSVISTIHMQLLIVSVIFLIFAVILAFVVSRRISRPLDEINEGVKELAHQNYGIEFNSTGYREAYELSETLNLTRRELRKVENLRQELIANISHDLRTPLTMITGYGEVMRDLPGENTPENVQVIIDEANRLTSLVNDMLDLSKLQSGAIEIEREEFCLTDSINQIFTRYAKLREQEGYNISFTADRKAYVYADEIKIGQVIYNFINNAINHCGDDKTVIVTQKTTDKRVRVEVTDHGEGIDPEKLSYIWDRYYKVDKTHRRGVIGTGLGLSIVKNILDLHGAKYGVKSKEGVGSTFWFELDITR